MSALVQSLVILGPIYLNISSLGAPPSLPNPETSTFVPEIDARIIETTTLLNTSRDDYTYTPGIGGYKLHTQAVTWNEARTTCEEEGGHLAIINSIAEANEIRKIFSNGKAIEGSAYPNVASIGFHDLFSEGQFVTIHGQTLERAGYSVWNSGDPSNSNGMENCGSVTKNGKLNDINCGSDFGFICEIPIY